MDKINFNHLYYFYLVAREGSIKNAADKVHVTQPTISDQLRLLEEYFDAKLFERKNRSLFLTKEGRLALSYAEKIFDMGADLTYRLRNKIEVPKANLDVGITHFMSHYFLYDKILPLFEQDNVSVRIKEGDRRHLLADLEEGKIDILFTDNKDSLSSTMSSYRVGINKTFAVGHKKFRKHKKDFPHKLDEIPFFNYTNESFFKYEIELFFTKYGLNPKIIGEADEIDLFQVVTDKALAFTIVPEAAKNRFIRNKDIIVLGELTELQTSVWGIVKNSYKGLGFQLLNDSLNKNNNKNNK